MSAKKILIRTHYGKNKTAIRLSDGRTATKRQCEAALKRCNAGEGDYLENSDRNAGGIIIWDGPRVWAIIA